MTRAAAQHEIEEKLRAAMAGSASGCSTCVAGKFGSAAGPDERLGAVQSRKGMRSAFGEQNQEVCLPSQRASVPDLEAAWSTTGGRRSWSKERIEVKIPHCPTGTVKP